MNLSVVFENTDVLVVDKPAGLLVHPGHGRAGETTLLELLSDYVGGDVYLVHRLDRDTSGLLVAAKTNLAKLYLQKQFAKREVQKTYLALVHGRPKHSPALLDLPIGRHPKNPLKRAVVGSGKPAQTTYKIVREYTCDKVPPCHYSLLEVMPKTGRTHQLRVHLAHLGYPIVGDSLYGKADSTLRRQFLHAERLRLRLPGGKTQTFTCSLPVDLKRYLDKLK